MIVSQKVSYQDDVEKNKNSFGNEKSSDSFVSVSDFSKIVSKVYVLEKDIKQLQSLCDKLLNQERVVEEKIHQLSNTTNYKINELRQELNNVNAANKSDENVVNNQYPQTVYASQLDNINPKGFTPASLTTSEGAHLYRITIESPTKASFVLTDNLAVQQELLLTLQSGILNDTCSFENSPIETSCQINTVECGKLVKEEGVWVILNKIKINFS